MDTQTVAPGPKAGRGLKLIDLIFKFLRHGVAPGPKAGRGLKLKFRKQPLISMIVAPGPKAGRGLKLLECAFLDRIAM